MANQPTRPSVKTQTRRRLCMAEQTHDKKPYLCLRDLDHRGDHTWVPRDQIPADLRDALLAGGGVDADATVELPEATTERATVTTAEARERLANEPPSGPLHSEVHDQAISQGIARRGPADTDAADLAVGGTHPHVQPNGLLPSRDAIDQTRPMPGGSIGHIMAGTSLKALYGIPEDVADEQTHGELAAQLLFEIAAESWGRKPPRLADAAKLVQLHGLLHHMLGARELLPTPDEAAHIARARGLVRGGGS